MVRAVDATQVTGAGLDPTPEKCISPPPVRRAVDYTINASQVPGTALIQHQRNAFPLPNKISRRSSLGASSAASLEDWALH